MDKLTHAKFNLNNFLIALSDAIDNTIPKNKNNISYSSKRIAYISIKIALKLKFEPSYISDIFSYSVIYNNPIAIENINQFPFINGSETIKNHKLLNEIVKVAYEIEQNIDIKYNIVINKDEIIKHIPNNFLSVFEDTIFWLDLSSNCHLPFYIFNNLQEFTQELEYTKLINLSEIINKISSQHSVTKNDIGKKCEKILKYYNFDNKDYSRLIISVNLHNIGKLFIPKELFIKDTKLTSQEYDIIKSIPYFTSLVIQQIFGFDDIDQLSSRFCEKLDGSGYPYKLKANNLSLKNRIISILTIYQALREDKSYRKAYTHSKAIDILKEDAILGKVDMSIVEDFDKQF